MTIDDYRKKFDNELFAFYGRHADECTDREVAMFVAIRSDA